MTTSTKSKIKFVTEINHVIEVNLRGRADLSFWKELLVTKGLYPLDKNGYAELVISAADLKWKGIRFNEFIINIAVTTEEHSFTHAGYYLIQGFNSVHLLALSERVFFSTPYYRGKISMKNRIPLEIGLILNEYTVFKASMAGGTFEHTTSPEGWTGPVFLPSGSKAERRYFIASINGETEIYPFSVPENTVSINPEEKYPVFAWLAQSYYEPFEWRVRSNALHKKSKTYREIVTV